ncbi:phage recombination protein Bet [Glutamicibacter arilaitensis]|uniref:phage recombination protein Bet n=1 Tax=Glutamicibacter arilaitensis TaxID=256701 RepID=UPI003FD2AB55
MSDIVVHQTQTTLAIQPEQTRFTDQQVTMLRHIGVEKAKDADLQVFFHQCQRTGLDPFARQIYMIERWSKEGPKYTIQTGIDGYRLIGRRAAQRAKETISVKQPLWAHPDGGWRDVWLPAWGTPGAAKVTILRGGEEFTAVALFDEYKQTKRDGGLTQMWAQRPAGQIAKCAEALAWRMAFPQDLAGIYTDTEMEQADNRPTHAPQPVQDLGEQVQVPMITADQWEAIVNFGQSRGIANAGVFVSETLGRQLRGWQEITADEVSLIMNTLNEMEAK